MSGLRNQKPIERIAVDERQMSDLEGMCGRDRQLAETGFHNGRLQLVERQRKLANADFDRRFPNSNALT